MAYASRSCDAGLSIRNAFFRHRFLTDGHLPPMNLVPDVLGNRAGFSSAVGMVTLVVLVASQPASAQETAANEVDPAPIEESQTADEAHGSVVPANRTEALAAVELSAEDRLAAKQVAQETRLTTVEKHCSQRSNLDGVQGRFTVVFDVAPDGRRSNLRLYPIEHAETDLAGCLLAAVRRRGRANVALHEFRMYLDFEIRDITAEPPPPPPPPPNVGSPVEQWFAAAATQAAISGIGFVVIGVSLAADGYGALGAAIFGVPAGAGIALSAPVATAGVFSAFAREWRFERGVGFAYLGALAGLAVGSLATAGVLSAANAPTESRTAIELTSVFIFSGVGAVVGASMGRPKRPWPRVHLGNRGLQLAWHF